MTVLMVVFLSVGLLFIISGMLCAFWMGYKAGAKEPLREYPYPDFVDLDEEVEKEKPIEEYFNEEDE